MQQVGEYDLEFLSLFLSYTLLKKTPAVRSLCVLPTVNISLAKTVDGFSGNCRKFFLIKTAQISALLKKYFGLKSGTHMSRREKEKNDKESIMQLNSHTKVTKVNNNTIIRLTSG